MSANTDEPSEKSQIREEMSQVQDELREALGALKREARNKMKPAEWAEIERDFADLDETLERLKDGKIWLAVVGKTNAGKSSVVNSLLEEDLALVGIKHDLTAPPLPGEKQVLYEKGPWRIVDLPGLMGNVEYERYSLGEAARAHGHLFVITEEPLQDEIEMFDKVHKALPDTPKIVFVNKWDRPMSRQDRAIVKERIEQKMGKYVKGNLADIVYGSARPFDSERDENVRQPLPQLLERMYEGVGTFGQVVTVIDPANRAHSLSESVRGKILDVRLRLARRIITAFGTASAASPMITGSEAATPALLVALVFVLCKILGQSLTRERAKGMAMDLLKACISTLAIDFVGTALAVSALQAAVFIPAVGLLALPALGAMAYFHYRRTVIFGEVVVEYVKNDFSWGVDGAAATIKRCKERALKSYMHLTKEAVGVG